MNRQTAPIEQTLDGISLQDRIRIALEEDINQGRLRPGDALKEQLLCERFQASRTPIREAILLLSARGLIDIIPRSGIYVKRLDARKIIAIMEGLAELEAVLARLAAQRVNEVQKQQLLACLVQTQVHAQAANSAAYAQANAALHELIYQSSANEFIAEQTQHARLRIAPYRTHMFAKPERLLQSQEEHQRIVQAIVQGDGEAAAQAMRTHISAGGQAFVEAALRAPSFESVPMKSKRGTGRERLA